MSQSPRILAFAGSTREASYNKRLLRIAAAGAREAGAEVTAIDLRDYPLPLYDGDLEERDGLPEPAVRLRALFFAHQGLLISAAEYNSSLTAVLKNTIDWVSRSEAGKGDLAPFRDKVAALVSASPGRLGGLRCLFHLRQILANIGVLVISQQQTVSGAGDAFDEAGDLKDKALQATVQGIGARLAETTGRLAR